jgi:hypothetical protein
MRILVDRLSPSFSASLLLSISLSLCLSLSLSACLPVHPPAIKIPAAVDVFGLLNFSRTSRHLYNRFHFHLISIAVSRTDALPQVAALAISSANGLLLKGGKEAINTNNFLMGIVKEALGHYGCADSIAMVTSVNWKLQNQ